MKGKNNRIYKQWNYQDGDAYVERSYYARMIDLLPDKNCNILDVGSGVAYGLEKMIFEQRKQYDDVIDCVDISPCNEKKPAFIGSYFQCNIEEEINLDKEYDAIVCFEVMEHVDQTDVLLQNCFKHLKSDGKFFLCIPNLSSIYARIELMLGFQPHILEISNEYANFGGGGYLVN